MLVAVKRTNFCGNKVCTCRILYIIYCIQYTELGRRFPKIGRKKPVDLGRAERSNRFLWKQVTAEDNIYSNCYITAEVRAGFCGNEKVIQAC